MPTAAGLDDLAVFGEAGQHAVQVVLLDPHRLRHLGDGDARTVADQVKCLIGARPGAARPPAAAAAATGGTAGSSTTGATARGRGGRGGGARGGGAPPPPSPAPGRPLRRPPPPGT